MPARDAQGRGGIHRFESGGPYLSQEALIAAMVAHLRLIERADCNNGNKAAIGRPPEQVLAIL